MRRVILFAAVVGALIGAFALGRAGAQDGSDEKGGPDDMDAWAALAIPGREHAELKRQAGTWRCACKSWKAPGAEPEESTGKSVQTMVLGDRFLMQEYEGTMMGVFFKGIGLTGYNNATNQYESVWLDSMGTGIVCSTGTETEKGKAWAYTGCFFGPGGAVFKTRSTIRNVSDDEQVMEMYCDTATGERKVMELTYTRER